MMKRPWVILMIGSAAGAMGGWLYWKYFGCMNGCAITSSPLNSTLYGALMGGLLINTFKKPSTSPAPTDNNTNKN